MKKRRRRFYGIIPSTFNSTKDHGQSSKVPGSMKHASNWQTKQLRQRLWSKLLPVPLWGTKEGHVRPYGTWEDRQSERQATDLKRSTKSYKLHKRKYVSKDQSKASKDWSKDINRNCIPMNKNMQKTSSIEAFSLRMWREINSISKGSVLIRIRCASHT